MPDNDPYLDPLAIALAAVEFGHILVAAELRRMAQGLSPYQGLAMASSECKSVWLAAAELLEASHWAIH